ncbi:MAG: mechanosensitive ion channel [Cyclobacteriaceae bacterium]|nr:mechanosensitive ion channel [Cyclobacteriaceae bacterium HetDA_MAG_MS6]
MKELQNLDLQKYSDQLGTMILEYAPKLALALATLIIGLWIISMILKGMGRVLEKRNVDPSLAPFLRSLFGILLRLMLLVSVIGMVGVEMTSFVAILGAAGLAVGLAMQGTLQNFAGGVMILLFKPFKVGDVIDAAGYLGSVREIQIFNTILNTPDNKRIIIPNGSLAGSSMTNFSSESTRRVDWTFGIGYGDDYDKAKSVLEKYIGEDERIMKDPAPFIALSALADSSVNIVVRVWVNPSDYWGVFFDMNERVYKGFAQEGLNIPFPQMDVHLHQNT